MKKLVASFLLAATLVAPVTAARAAAIDCLRCAASFGTAAGPCSLCLIEALFASVDGWD